MCGGEDVAELFVVVAQGLVVGEFDVAGVCRERLGEFLRGHLYVVFVQLLH